MMIKKAVAGILTAGVLTLGTTGVAFAATGGTPQAAASQGTAAGQRADRCQKAEAHLDALNKRLAALEARIDKLQKRVVQARAHHREDLAERLEKRIDKLQKAKERVADRIQRIHERCDGAATTQPAQPAQ